MEYQLGTLHFLQMCKEDELNQVGYNIFKSESLEDQEKIVDLIRAKLV